MAILAVALGGAEGFIIGMLIDGRSHKRGLRPGPWAYGLAAAGALGGSLLGATVFEPGTSAEHWMAGPPPWSAPYTRSWSPWCRRASST